MIERWDPTEPLPPVYPQGPLPLVDGDRVRREPVPLPEPDRRRALRLTALVALVVAVAIALGRVL